MSWSSPKTLRYVAITEATSFLALLVFTYIKYHDHSPAGVQILGPIHGALFLAYIMIALIIRPDAGWSNRTTGLILLGSVIPFGGYVVERWLSINRRPTTEATA
jgi:integral membrane protein